jgi:hypothetical protein
MSDAQAAQVTENGVPPTAQDKPEETPGFKVPLSSATSPRHSPHPRFLLAILRIPPRKMG